MLPETASRARPCNPYSPSQSAPPRLLSTLSSRGRLHFAIVAVIAAVGAATLWLPIFGSPSSSAQQQSGLSVLILADGLSYALRTHAETVAGALAEAGLTLSAEDSVLQDGRQVPSTSPLLTRSLLLAAGRGAIRAAFSSSTNLPLILQLQRAIPFTVQEEGLIITLYSSRRTVGQALAALGIPLRPQDLVAPPPDTPLSAGLNVFVRRARTVDLMAAGQPGTVLTHARTVGQLLAEQGIAVGPLDRLIPPAETPVREGLRVELTVVREESVAEKDLVLRDVIYWEDPELAEGESYVLEWGNDGVIRREYKVVYENGQEVSRTLLSETYEPPSEKIVVQGTYIPFPTQFVADCGSFSYTRSLVVYATWYNAASAGGSGITATGIPVDHGVVAVDPSVIPLGTRMCIPGYGVGVAADTGGAIKGNVIDLGYPDGVIPDWFTGFVEIYILD